MLELLPDPELNKLAERALCEPRDETAWHDLHPQIAEICARVCGPTNENHCDDLTQETSSRISNSVGKESGYQPGRPFRSWCAQIARNALIDIIRKERKGGRNETSTAPPGDDTPSNSHVGRNEKRERPTAVSLDEYDPPDPDGGINWNKLYDNNASFNQADIKKLRVLYQKKPKSAVQVLAVYWLWILLPPGEWQRWLEQLRQPPAEINIPDPWPPIALLQEENPRKELLNEVARVFRITPEGVVKTCNRYKEFLLSLDRVKDYLD